MGDEAIQTRALRKDFGETVAVSNLTLTVRRGEVFGFLGPNGAGKTTSVKMLLGLVAPTAGAATVLGRPLGDPRVRARIGFLPEHGRFHDSLTARELLEIHGRLHGLRGSTLQQRINHLLARVNLLDAQRKLLRHFSKGMAQRVGLAQALIGDPELLFLDEPTSGLDPLGRVLVRRIIEEVRARGSTVFLNSHLLSEVETTCNRVAFVKQGRIIQELRLADPTVWVNVELKIDRTDPEILLGLQAFGRDVRVDGGVVRLYTNEQKGVPEIVRWLVERGVAVYSVGSHRKSLEQRFIEIMGEDQGPG
jgi:ABC-2 type transport system ATP-binding protein